MLRWRPCWTTESRSTQSSRFSFNTFQFPVDFILKGPGSVCCPAQQIFCQSCRKIFCEMRVFCIVNANLYLNGTDHGQTDRIISGKISAEQNVKTNEAAEFCLCLWPGCSGFHGCKSIEQQATLQCPEDVQISGGGISQLGRSFSMNYSEVTISNSIPQHWWIFD